MAKKYREQHGEGDGGVGYQVASERNENESGRFQDTIYAEIFKEVSFEDNISEGEICYDVNYKGYLSDGEVCQGWEKWLKSDQDGDNEKYCCKEEKEGDTIGYDSPLLSSNVMHDDFPNTTHCFRPESCDIDVTQQTYCATKNDLGNRGRDIERAIKTTSHDDVLNAVRHQAIDSYKAKVSTGELHISSFNTSPHEFTNSSIPNELVAKLTDLVSDDSTHISAEEHNLNACSHECLNVRLSDESVTIAPTSPMNNGRKKNILIKCFDLIRKRLNKN